MKPRKPASIDLDLSFETLEQKSKRCCGSSTTLPICTCPIRLTDCCDYPRQDRKA